MSDVFAQLRARFEREAAELSPASRAIVAAQVEVAGRAELEPECPRCGGARFYRVPASPGSKLFGRPIPCECLPLTERAALAGIPYRYRALTLDTFPALDGKAAALAWARAWDGRRSVVLFGEPGVWGSGKTGLACAMVRPLLERGERVRFVRVADVLEEAKSLFDAGGDETAFEYFARVRSEPVLILDDLGAEVATPWAMQQLATLVDYRFTRDLPTLITTNLVYSDVHAHLGGAVASRLGNFEWVYVGGVDLRTAVR